MSGNNLPVTTLGSNVVSSGGQPTIVGGTSLGTTGHVASITSGSTDNAGSFTLTSGAGATSGQLATITFSTPFSSTPRSIVISPANNSAAIQIASFTGTLYPNNVSGSSFDVNCFTFSGAMTAASYYYIVIG